MARVVRVDPVERRVVLAMLTDAAALAAIAPHWTSAALQSRWAMLVGTWCVSHWEKLRAAPGRNIEGYFHRWKDSRAARASPETADCIEAFLSSVSDDYAVAEGLTATLPEIEDAMNRSRWKKFYADLSLLMEAGDYAEAEKLRNAFRPVRFGGSGYIDTLDAAEQFRESLQTASAPPLIRYGGAMGEFYGNALDRGCFVAYNAPEKRGKSAFLLDQAFRAVLQRCKVAYFECGDMTQAQLLRRLAARATGRPVRPREYLVPRSISVCEPSEKRTRIKVDFEKCESTEPLDWNDVVERFIDIHERWVRDDVGYLRLQCHPSGTLSVAQAQHQLEVWASAGWSADVVIFDYADILAPSARMATEQLEINDTWQRMRGLSQVHNCLVLTATQAKSSALSKDRMDAADTGGRSKTKNAHITAGVAINQTSLERREQIMNLSWTHNRDDAGDRSLYVANCLAVWNPMVLALLDWE